MQQLLRFLDICDGNMQEGSFRCDVNISLRPTGQVKLGTRTELKNLNSFRFIEKAIQYEQIRHQDMLETGQRVAQETRLYCPNTNTTQLMRSKENENDYRYFPDPDLLPIKITAEDLAQTKENLPTLPSEIRQRLLNVDNLNADDSDFVLTSKALVQFYDDVKRQSHAEAKTIVNWLKGTYTAALHEQGLTFEQPPVSAFQMSCLLDRLTDKIIPAQLAKIIFSQLMTSDLQVDELITASGYQQKNDNNQIEDVIRTTIDNHPQQAADYRAGKEKLLAFFVGQVMKQLKGQADPAEINLLLRKYLHV